jgi:hypothetical protein
VSRSPLLNKIVVRGGFGGGGGMLALREKDKRAWLARGIGMIKDWWI